MTDSAAPSLSAADAFALTRQVDDRVRTIPDFPRPGILFRDISPVLQDAQTLQAALDLHVHAVSDLVGSIEVVAGIESRGFLFGMALAARLGAGFVLVRKPGKLPYETREVAYALEYGEDRLQIHADAIRPGQRVLVVDDLLATGGTAGATCRLVEGLGGSVEAALFLIELTGLRGRARLEPRRVETILQY